MNVDRQQFKRAMINLAEEVADNWLGIKDENKIRLFESNFSTKKYGIGFGLTIVHIIVADHKGLIRIKNNQPEGTKFIIELPVKI